MNFFLPELVYYETRNTKFVSKSMLSFFFWLLKWNNIFDIFAGKLILYEVNFIKLFRDTKYKFGL